MQKWQTGRWGRRWGPGGNKDRFASYPNYIIYNMDLKWWRWAGLDNFYMRTEKWWGISIGKFSWGRMGSEIIIARKFLVSIESLTHNTKLCLLQLWWYYLLRYPRWGFSNFHAQNYVFFAKFPFGTTSTANWLLS